VGDTIQQMHGGIGGGMAYFLAWNRE